MNISMVQSTVASFSLGEANQISKEQLEQLLQMAQQVQTAPMQQKMVLHVNQALQDGRIDIMA